MAFDVKNINIAGKGHVRVAPAGTALPTGFGTSAVWDPAWVDTGFTSDKGVTVNVGATTQDINVWQKFYPALKIVTARTCELSGEMNEFNKDTIPFAFGGGAWTVQGGVAVYTPPTPDQVDLRMMCVDWASQGMNYRFTILEGINTSTVQTQLTRTNDSVLPFQFSALGSGDDTVQPWTLATDNPSILAALAAA